MSTTSNALNVAGSIGGVAQAAGNLASLLGGSNGSQISAASYGGIPFAVRSTRTSGGRKYAIHEYPFREDGWLEDTGKKLSRLSISGFLVENSLVYGGGPVIQQRDRLFNMCVAKDAPPRTLVHPTFGTVPNMLCVNLEFEEDLSSTQIGVTFTFMKAGARAYPTTTVTTAAASINNASLMGIAALLNFVQKTASAIQAGAAVVQQAVSTAVGWYQFAVTAVNDVKSIIGSVSTLFGNFGRLFGGANNGYAGANVQALPSVTADDLLSQAAANRSLVMAAGTALQTAAANPGDSTDLGAAVQNLISTLAATAADPADAVTMLSTMAQYQPAPVTTPGQIGAAMLVMQVALSALFRRYALAQLAVTLTTYQPSSQNDAQTVLTNATALFDSEITIAGDAGDDESYMALRTLRQSMIADLTARAANLASIETFTFQASLPSLALAQRIYRDPTQEPALVQQAAPRHPAFMPTVFQALAPSNPAANGGTI
ncbi:DNA circularization protein [Paraburkholderia sediminicola]|uniref:DNA circularization protein n=1 Tax=Paraburkholderia sediminicola TaxID=458836 RepID=UPI0038BA7125